MESSKAKRQRSRKARVMRVRKKLRGTADKPRLSVFKSNNHLSAQLIDDEKGVTIAGIGTFFKENRKTQFQKRSKESAKHIGEQIAKLAKKHKIKTIIFDRGRFQYHGLIAELADSAREQGLQF